MRGVVDELVDHGAAVWSNEGKVSTTRGDFEIGVELRQAPAAARGEDNEIGITVESDLCRETPFDEIGGVAGEMIAIEVDSEGVGVVDLDPV